MKRHAPGGFTIVELMIVMAIIVLLVSVAVPNLLKARMAANDGYAIKILKAMADSSEVYSSVGYGNYPGDMTSLTGATPPYISLDYCTATQAGFTFSCANAAGGYTYYAVPVNIGTTGSTTYTMTTGAILSP